MKGVRDSLEIVLSVHGHQVEFAKNGAEGLKMAEASTYDLVITDMLMPELDGSEVIRQLKASGNPARVLAISAGGDGISASQALNFAKEHADAVMEKPFAKEELLKEVAALTG